MNEDYKNDLTTPVEKLNLLLCSAGRVTNEFLQTLTLTLNVLTQNIKEFHCKIAFTDQPNVAFEKCLSEMIEAIYSDKDEWELWCDIGDPVLHIDLTKWADLLLLAPMDLNTLAKTANGMCDNLVTCIVRAWNIKKPLIFCPAITKAMRDSQLTQKHLNILRTWGYIDLLPSAAQSKASAEFSSACSMADPVKLANLVMKVAAQNN